MLINRKWMKEKSCDKRDVLGKEGTLIKRNTFTNIPSIMKWTTYNCTIMYHWWYDWLNEQMARVQCILSVRLWIFLYLLSFFCILAPMVIFVTCNCHLNELFNNDDNSKDDFVSSATVVNLFICSPCYARLFH